MIDCSHYLVKKSSGKKEAFSERKLLVSLIKSGISNEDAKAIVRKVKDKISTNVSTRSIHRLVCRLLRNESKKAAAYYNLSRAILELGPDGYLFEKFIAKLLSSLGYKTKTGVTLQGKCVSHEVDVVATNLKHTIYCECKFHNSRDYTNDVKIALYINARKMDLLDNKDNDFQEFWLVSNTKFSLDAIKYANCAGLKLIGRNAPENDGLVQLVEKTGLHPITSLTKLKKYHVKKLIKEGIVLCKDLESDIRVLNKLNLSEKEIKAILKEIKQLKTTVNGVRK